MEEKRKIRKALPESNNKRIRTFSMNLSEEEYKMLDDYCKKHSVSKASIARLTLSVGLDSLIDDDKSREETARKEREKRYKEARKEARRIAREQKKARETED